MAIQQIIYNSENKATSTIYTYEIEDLKNKIEKSEIINTKYFKDINIKNFNGIDDINKIYKKKKEIPAFNFYSEKMEGELWRKYPNIEDLLVSNKGRLKYNGKIVEQVEEYQNNLYKTHIGYLQIKKNDNKDLWKILKENYVYQVVAKVWLIKPENECQNCIYEVHHITNDGYDNRPENLIYLTLSQHNKVHSSNNY